MGTERVNNNTDPISSRSCPSLLTPTRLPDMSGHPQIESHIGSKTGFPATLSRHSWALSSRIWAAGWPRGIERFHLLCAMVGRGLQSCLSLRPTAMTVTLPHTRCGCWSQHGKSTLKSPPCAHFFVCIFSSPYNIRGRWRLPLLGKGRNRGKSLVPSHTADFC